MKTMEYQITIVIKKNRKFVVETYMDYEQFKYYQQPAFDSYRLLEGQIYEVGSVVELVYKYKGQLFFMHEKITACNLPESITQVYLLGETKNRCISSFREANGNTIWHMDVHFQFEADEGQDKKVFMKKTEEDMMAFKTYVEGL